MYKSVIISLCLICAFSYEVSGKEYKRVCYYTNWSQYRPGVGRYTPDNIEPRLCTHLIYAFAKVINSELKTYEWNDEQMYKKFNDLKTQQPGLKTLIAVGGWNAGSAEFTTMVSSRANRQKFVRSTVQFLRQHGFDGLDLDWEYPTKRGGQPSDKHNFVLLVQELKEAFEADRFLLTAAVPAGKSNIDDGYEVATLAQTLDFINVMTYDLHGGWEKHTGENSPLDARSGEVGEQRYLNMKWAVDYWASKGAPKHKLVIGMATYGRTFTLADPSNTTVGAPATGPGQAGRFTGEAGFLSYYEICTLLESGRGTTHWEEEQMVPYYTNDKLWVGYDNDRSITAKVQWLMKEGYGGAMIWALDLDDFNRQCKSSTVRYPLLTTIHNLLTSHPIPPEPETTTTKHEQTTHHSKQTTPKSTSTTTTTTTTTQKTTTTTHSGSEFSCANKADGFYPDPNDKHCFYRCVNGQAFHFRCPGVLVYDAKNKICTWPTSVSYN